MTYNKIPPIQLLKWGGHVKKGAMAQHLLQTTISRSLRDINDGPKRAIRNLVELGENFSVGRSQLDFFKTIHSMLKSENSAYYTLWETLTRETDHDSLKTFGINVGYNGCTTGVKALRELSKKHCCGIPSVLTVMYDGSKMDKNGVDNIVRQGETLGIFTYIISHHGGELEALAPVFGGHSDSGFVILANGSSLCDQTVFSLTKHKNVMLSVSADESSFEEVCKGLRAQHILFCVHTKYDDVKSDEILSGSWVEKVEPFVSTLALLIPDDEVSESTIAKVGAFAYSCRMEMRYPLILMDYRLDVAEMNRAISRNKCSATFDTDGQLITESGKTLDACLNIVNCSLLEIFRKGLAIDREFI